MVEAYVPVENYLKFRFGCKKAGQQHRTRLIILNRNHYKREDGVIEYSGDAVNGASAYFDCALNQLILVNAWTTKTFEGEAEPRPSLGFSDQYAAKRVIAVPQVTKQRRILIGDQVKFKSDKAPNSCRYFGHGEVIDRHFDQSRTYLKVKFDHGGTEWFYDWRFEIV